MPDSQPNPDDFWDKLRRTASKIGKELFVKIASMWFALQDKDTPMWAKAIIVAAIGYFIFPADAIPDIIPGGGFVDDAGAIATALGTVAIYIKPAHEKAARELWEEWFGPDETK